MTLTVYAAPLRGLFLHEIDTDDVLGVLKPIWNKIPETVDRLRGRIENVLDAAKAKGLRKGENCPVARPSRSTSPASQEGAAGASCGLAVRRHSGFYLAIARAARPRRPCTGICHPDSGAHRRIGEKSVLSSACGWFRRSA
ncbi:hypothetical protein GGR38_004113 [Novosphingobium sediminicola]|uniref:Phage integrase central domain-containing protein n=2 Tax=Novosphingobium sediminicola TaxID=563162 RepID=A0A7W6CM21_9SPHN|nr:hypothetical protein [Novosphingobium sediminicola]